MCRVKNIDRYEYPAFIVAPVTNLSRALSQDSYGYERVPIDFFTVIIPSATRDGYVP